MLSLPSRTAGRLAPAFLVLLLAPSAAGQVPTAANLLTIGPPPGGNSLDVELAKTPTPDEQGLFGDPVPIALLNTSTGEQVATINMKLAVTSREQEHGLMFIRSMPQNDGMIFMYKNPDKRVLWMQDTYIPLDVGWFTQDGVLEEVQQLVPHDTTYRYSHSSAIYSGVEMNVNWFSTVGALPGAVKLDLVAIRRATSARGFEPLSYFPETASSLVQTIPITNLMEAAVEPHADDSGIETPTLKKVAVSAGAPSSQDGHLMRRPDRHQ